MRFGHILIFVTLFATAFGQRQYMSDRSQFQSMMSEKSLFQYKTYSNPIENSDKVEFSIYLKIAYDLLHFVVNDTLFESRYESTVVIRDRKGNYIDGKIKRDKIFVRSYEETNSSNKFATHRFSFMIHPGRYKVSIELLDLETHNPVVENKEIVIPDFYSSSLSVSDLIFYQTHDGDTLDENLFPSFPPVRSVKNPHLYAKFYIYSENIPLKINMHRKITTSNNKQILFEDSIKINLLKHIQPISINIDQDLNFGKYYLNIFFYHKEEKISLRSPFYIRWGKQSTLMTDFRLAIETLQYIMDRKQWQQLIEKPVDEQIKLVEKFWDERDPEPETEVNELREEFYRRVNFANKNFTPFDKHIDGWKTDRGRIYILYGPPSDIERPITSSETSSRYEIWHYRNIQRSFIFIAKDATGDFYLVSEE